MSRRYARVKVQPFRAKSQPSLIKRAKRFITRQESAFALAQISGKKQGNDMENDIFSCIINDNIEAVMNIISENGVDVFSWKKYGSYGPGILFWCYLYRKYETARKLIDIYPKGVLTTVDSELYRGETVLHAAIIHGNLEEVSFLASLEMEEGAGDDVGKFFNEDQNSKDQEHSETRKHNVSSLHIGRALVSVNTSGAFFAKGSVTYFGESPLLFAVSTNQWRVVELLLESQQSDEERLYLLTKTNSYGDNALHMTVLWNLPDMYKLIVKAAMNLCGVEYTELLSIYSSESDCVSHMRNSFANAINLDGFSPLTLAGKQGNREMVEIILMTWGRTMWEYGPAKRLLLPLEGIDVTYGPDTSGVDKIEGVPPTLLEVICACNTHDLMHISVLSAFVVKKWLSSNHTAFLVHIAAGVIKSLLLIGYVVTSNDDSSSGALAFGILFLLFSAVEFAMEMMMFVKFGVRYLQELNGTAKAMSVLSLLSTLCLLAYIACKAAGFMQAEKVFVGLLSLVQTLNATCHLIGFERTGELIMIILQIMQEDVSTYLVVYSMGVLGFTVPFYVLTPDTPLHSEAIYMPSSRPLTFLVQVSELMFDALSNSISGTLNLNSLAVPWFAYVLIILFAVYFTVLLLNLLVAMMNDTYFKVKRTSKNRWIIQLGNVMRRMDLMRRSVPVLWRRESKDGMKIGHSYATSVNGVLYIELDKVNREWNNSRQMGDDVENDSADDADVKN